MIMFNKKIMELVDNPGKEMELGTGATIEYVQLIDDLKTSPKLEFYVAYEGTCVGFVFVNDNYFEHCLDLTGNKPDFGDENDIFMSDKITDLIIEDVSKFFEIKWG